MKSAFRDFFVSRTGILWTGMFASLIFFVIDWSVNTTFRDMSDWILYPVNILAAFLLVLPYVFTRKVWIQGIVMCAVQILLLCNLMYCRTYFTAIPGDSYSLAGNLSDFTASVRDSLKWYDFGFPIILILSVAAAYRARSVRSKEVTKVYIISSVVTAFVVVSGIISKGGFYKEYDRLSQSCYYSTCGVPIYTVGGHLLYDLMSRNDTQGAGLEETVESWLDEHEKFAPYKALPDTVERRSNLVIILLESLESWVVENDIEGQPIAPYLRSLAADSTTLYAPNVLTQVASGRSIDCQLLVNCGLLPMMSSVYSMRYPATHYPSLNKAMREQYGTESVLFTCDKPITWNQSVISRAFGCDTLIDRTAWVHDEMVGNPPKLSDRSFLRQCVELLEKGEVWHEGESRYLTFVTYSGHNPFVLPDNLKDPSFKWNESAYPQKMNDYITMAHYTDSSLRQLIEYLKSRGDYKSTLIVITGDHEGLASDRKDILKNKEAAKIVDNRQMTPLIILNSPVAGRRDEVIGQVDIYPTLLNLLGLDNYYWKGVGRSIVSPGAPEFAISSMTNEIVGDTATFPAESMPHYKNARRISDAMIARDMFKEY